MGSCVSVTLAILAMDRLEHSCVYNNPTAPLPLFVCYIDDCDTAAKSGSTAQDIAFLND